MTNLIDEATLTALRGWMAEATFEDGRATAGGNAAKVKHNEQVSSDRPDLKLGEMPGARTPVSLAPRSVNRQRLGMWIPGRVYPRLASPQRTARELLLPRPC